MGTFNSPQHCAHAGLVWDDAFPWRAEMFGGLCEKWEDLSFKLNAKMQHLELVVVNLTLDPAGSLYDGAKELQIR